MKRTRQCSFLLPCEYIATSGSCGCAAGQPTSLGPLQRRVPADTKPAELGNSALPAPGLHGAEGRGARTWRAAECMRRRRCSGLQLRAAQCYCWGNPHGQRASAHIWSCHRALNLWKHSTKYREMYAGTYFHKASQPDDPGIIIGSLAYTVVFQLTIPLSLLPSLLWHISYSGSSYEPRISQKRIPGEA